MWMLSSINHLCEFQALTDHFLSDNSNLSDNSIITLDSMYIYAYGYLSMDGSYQFMDLTIKSQT